MKLTRRLRSKYVTYDELVFYITENGIEGTSQLLNMSVNKIESILYPKSQKQKEYVFSEILVKHIPTIDYNKVVYIYECLTQHYNELHDQFVQNRNCNVINCLSNTAEDVFHNAILMIVQDMEYYQYENEEQTLNYIKTRIFHSRIKENLYVKRNIMNNKTEIKEDNILESLNEENYINLNSIFHRIKIKNKNNRV